MKLLKNGLSIRGDSYYCPLSFQLDTYWNCATECRHCYLRRLNRTWGKDLRPLDIPAFRKKIENGLKNKNPKSSLACAIKNKKTIRLGNKTDPYQTADIKHLATREALKILMEHNWSVLIQTKFTDNIYRDMGLITPKNVSIMPIISPGMEKDWELFEKKLTTHPEQRLDDIENWQKEGFNVGVNGEPFIPGYHTIDDFRHTLEVLKLYNIRSYNTYFLHMNDWNLKNFYNIGLDIEKIYTMNQDENWKPILRQLIRIAEEEGITLGCPDFVNSGTYQEKTNTCCGMNVPNPCSFNIMNWKKLWMKGERNIDRLIQITWDGIGNIKTAKEILSGKNKEFYNLTDIKELEGTNGISQKSSGNIPSPTSLL